MANSRSYHPHDALGAVLLIGALFVFGLFNFTTDEPLVEAGLRAQAATIAGSSRHAIAVMVEGRDIMARGWADSAEERNTLIAALRGIEGRGRLNADLRVLEPMTPFELSADWTARNLSLAGGIPSEIARAALRDVAGDAVDTLKLASGAQGPAWTATVESGLRALRQLEHGKLRLLDAEMELAGAALTPAAERAARSWLDDLPEGTTVRFDITVLDDGTPLRLVAKRRDGTLAGLRGKLPKAIAAELPQGDVTLSPLPPPFEGWGRVPTAALTALNHLRNADMILVGASLSLSGEAWSQAARESALAALDTLPTGMRIDTDIVLMDDGAPFELIMDMRPEGIDASGKVPQSLGPRVLAALAGAPVFGASLTIASVSPGPSWWDTGSLVAEAMRFVEGGDLRFDGVSLAGSLVVADPAAEAALRAHLAQADDDVAQAVEIALIDDGTPLRLALRFDGRAGIADGKWPESLAVGRLSAALGAPVSPADVIRTPKPAPAGWRQMAEQGAAALGLLRDGTLILDDMELSLSGVALSPETERAVQAAVAQLPREGTARIALTVLDDGRPFAFSVEFDGASALLSGKVPADLGPASQSAIMGRPVRAGALELSEIPADPDWWSAARATLKALALLDDGRLAMDARQITLTGTASDASTRGQIESRLGRHARDFALRLEIAVP